VLRRARSAAKCSFEVGTVVSCVDGIGGPYCLGESGLVDRGVLQSVCGGVLGHRFCLHSAFTSDPCEVATSSTRSKCCGVVCLFPPPLSKHTFVTMECIELAGASSTVVPIHLGVGCDIYAKENYV